MHKLSKSSYLRGLQCEKLLYLSRFHPELSDTISESQQAVFTRGTNVGIFAQQLFPGGVNCAPPTHREYELCIQKTKEAIDSGVKVLYEAGFVYDDVLVLCDILVKEGDNWKIYEVKSSTSVSDVYLDDAAIQYYVVSNSLPNVSDISIVHLNNKYVRSGELDINELFTIESVKEIAVEKEDYTIENLMRFKKVLNKKTEPKIDIGPHCSAPYDCSFHGHCWQHIPQYSVFDISRLNINKKFELYDSGILNIIDIPDDYPLNHAQRLQVESEKSKSETIDIKYIKEFLSEVKYPIAYMDFETFMPAIPLFDNSRPYQQIVFQYSVHYQENETSEIKHFEYLAEADLITDPRIGFIKQLINDLEGAKTIIVYNQGFETGRLKEIARDFPEFEKPVQSIIDKIFDLMKPFQNKSYYTHEMQGSYSIKKVLPALVPELSYENLEIGEGGTASREFEALYYESDGQVINKVRTSLLEYCKLDTLAMVKIYECLKNIIKN